MKRFRLAALAGALLLATAIAPLNNLAWAEDYFIPNAPRQGAQPAPSAAARPTPRPAQAQSTAPIPSSPIATAALPPILPTGGESDAQPGPLPPLPPLPALPALEKTAPPPVPVIGVLGVPEIMRGSIAAQAVDRIIGERRQSLNEDAQREQAAWREMQQALASQRSTMSPEQVRLKERDLQDRITSAQKQFRDRARIIQEAAQYGVSQIERALVAVIRQVAEAHGMNLVLHRSEVALNVSELDISEQVANQLNLLLPSVVIPPEGVSPSAMGAPPSNVVGPTGTTAIPPNGPRR